MSYLWNTLSIPLQYLIYIFPILSPYSPHTLPILSSYSPHTLPILSSYSPHTLLILSSYSPHTLLILSSGFGKDELATLQKLVNGENSDLFDVLEYVFNSSYKLISREQRVANAQQNIFALLNINEKEFLAFVLSKYIECGVEELDQEKLPDLLKLKYQAISDAEEKLGGVANIRDRFIGFQKWLYEGKVA
jgi:hypothetical protein